MNSLQTLLNQGINYEKSKQWDLALAIYQQLNIQNPKNALISLKLLRVFRMLNKIEPAKALLESLEKLSLGKQYLTLFYYEAGQLSLGVADFVKARFFFENLIELQPNFADGQCLLGRALQELGLHSQAVECFQYALSLGVYDKSQAQCLLASSLAQSHRESQAMDLYQQVIALDPKNATAHYGLGMIYQVMGKFTHSEKSFLKSIELDPEFGDAYQQLCHTRKIKYKDDPIIALLKNRLACADNLTDQVRLSFGLGKAYDDCAEYETAMEYYHQGNAIKKSMDKSYDPNKWEKYISQLIALFPKELFNNEVIIETSITPCWIVGLPRSGTSLCEQMISAHSQVYGAGELTFFAQDVPKWLPFQKLIPLLSENNIHSHSELIQIREKYLDLLKQLGGNHPFVIDKYPANFLQIGLAKLIFPQIKIIYTTRDALDNCLSIYFQDFVSGNSYSHHLPDIAHYYNQMKRLMSHWKQVFPKQIHEVRYEDVLSNQEAEIKKMLRYCQLNWEAECLDFVNNKRIVNTFSHWQVRQSIYKTSQERWRNYQSHLTDIQKYLAL